LLAPLYSYAVFRGAPAALAPIYATPTMLAAAAVGAAWLLASLPAFAGQPLARALVIGAVSPALYLALARSFARSSFELVSDQLVGLIRRRLSPPPAPAPATGGG